MQKFGLYYILPLRWGVLLSATLNALLTPGARAKSQQYTALWPPSPLSACL